DRRRRDLARLGVVGLADQLEARTAGFLYRRARTRVEARFVHRDVLELEPPFDANARAGRLGRLDARLANRLAHREALLASNRRTHLLERRPRAFLVAGLLDLPERRGPALLQDGLAHRFADRFADDLVARLVDRRL